MTPDSEAFIQQSLLPQTSTPAAAAAAASTALTAVVLRPPLSTAATTATSSAATKTTVISLTQTPHSKPGLVILLGNYYLHQNSVIATYTFILLFLSALLFCVSHSLSPCADSAPATGGNGKATGDAGSASHGDTQRTNT